MPRATLCVDVDCDEDVAAFEDWFEVWESQLSTLFNDGCGCCVDLWNIEGPAEAVDSIPERLQCLSAWSADCH